MNVAYMLSGQGVFGIQIYYKEINNRKFIDFRRLNKVVDIDFLFDEVVPRTRPLNTAKVIEAHAAFYVSVLKIDTAETVVLRTREYQTEIMSLFKATTAVPVVYNRTIQVGTNGYIDGGTLTPIPLQHAIEGGCTDLVVFLTRPQRYRSGRPHWWERQLFSLRCAKDNRILQRRYESAYAEGNRCRDICFGVVPPPRPINIATFCPSETDTELTRLTTDGVKLKNSAIEMALATLRVFGGTPSLIDDLVMS